MLVYGDPEYRAGLRPLLNGLEQRLAVTRPDCLDELRTLLIQIGQVEQAAEDAWPGPDLARRVLRARIRDLTVKAATAFHQVWSSAWASNSAQPVASRSALAPIRQALKALPCENAEVTVKIPEGFEFYALFPEQYCLAALRWAQDRADTWPKRAAVVGIRSIGTTLSAVATAALQATGWEIERFTVRPARHPFARQVELPEVDLRGIHRALVVDEGPGISGSSMAATAQALAERGIGDISFLPGHQGEPGSAASAEARHWWAKTPRYAVRVEELRWGGRSLPESLAERSSHLWKDAEEFAFVEDLSAGRWREVVYSEETDWPASSGMFERMKFRCTNREGRAVLWKFAGFGCATGAAETSVESAMKRMAERGVAGLSPAPLGGFRGFIATPWIEGKRLTRKDSADASILAYLGHYVTRTAGASLEREEWQASIERVAEMLYWNTKETLGDQLAERTRAWAEAARHAQPGPAYGDGRMAPHEWVRTPSGALLKTDGTGHDLDHTLVGRQSVLWDIAGAIVEWDLAAEAVEVLAKPLCPAKTPVDSTALMFYQLAYAAFRLGQTSLCALQCSNPPEQTRLHRALEFYKRQLAHLLLNRNTERRESPKGATSH